MCIIWLRPQRTVVEGVAGGEGSEEENAKVYFTIKNVGWNCEI